MNEQLIRPVTQYEIKRAAFSINPSKAPHDDELTCFFFHKFWYIVGDEVCEAIRCFFH